MNTKRKWIAYGVTGAVGIGVLAGGAAVAANAMDLRTTDGTAVPGGVITGRDGGMLERGNVELRVTDSSVSVISPPSPTSVASASSWSDASVGSAPSPVAPSVHSPASSPSADSPASEWSVDSGWSVGSVGSD